MYQTVSDLNEKIKTLKLAREILNSEYEKTDLHKKKVEHPHESVPASPEDEEIYKLLHAIHQIDKYIKKFQDEQFTLIKQQENL